MLSVLRRTGNSPLLPPLAQCIHIYSALDWPNPNNSPTVGLDPKSKAHSPHSAETTQSWRERI